MRLQMQYALHMMCADKTTRIMPQLTGPYVFGDYVVATDAHLLVLVPKDSYTTPDVETEGNKPDPFKVVNLSGMDDREMRHVAISDMEKALQKAEQDKHYGITLDATAAISAGNTRKVTQFCRMMGIANLKILNTSSRSLTFSAEYRDDAMYIVVILYKAQGGEPDVRTIAGEADTAIHPQVGKDFYKQHKEREEEHRRQWKEGDWPCYEVTVVRYQTICVKAESESEARDIARGHQYLLDYDEYEIEGCRETHRYNAENNFDIYYDKSGRRRFDEE